MDTANTTSKSKFSRNNKKKNHPATNSSAANINSQQYESFNTTITSTNNTSMFNNVALSVSNNSNRDSSSINSEDSNEPKTNNNNNNNNLGEVNLNGSPLLINSKKANANENGLTIPSLSLNNNGSSSNQTSSNNNTQNNGSITARSISSITGSLSFDLLDQLKLNGSDIDSEGYSIRPDSSSDLRRMNKNGSGEPFKNKDNEDMNNLYGVSSTESDSDDSDSENGDNSSGPVKVMLKIKPIDEIATKPQNNSDVLRQISKNLQLKPLGAPISLNRLQQQQQTNKKRTYYYNYGTANPDQVHISLY